MNYIKKWKSQNLPDKKLIIIGAGSLGKLTIDCILRNNEYSPNNIAVLDDNDKIQGKSILGISVIGSINCIEILRELITDLNFVIAIANNQVRREIVKKYPDLSYSTIISRESVISPHAEIGHGCIILPGVIVDPDAKIKDHVIVNKSSTIAHDVTLHDFSQISPGVNFGGYVELGECSFIGLGASVLPSKRITKNVIVGAGAVVTKHIEVPFSIYIGNPAKLFKITKD